MSGPNTMVRAMLRGGSVSMVLSLGSVVLGFVTNFVLVRVVGSDGFGRYSIAVGWSMVLAILLTFGMDLVILRFAPVYLEEGRTEQVGRLIGFAMALLSISALLSLLGLAALDYLRPGLVGVEGFSNVVAIVVLAASWAGLVIYSSVFRAAKSIFFSQFYLQIARSLLLLAAVGAAAVLTQVDATMALKISAAITVASMFLVLGHFTWAQTLGGQGLLSLPRWPAADDRRAWLDMAWPSLISATLQQLVVQTGVIAIGLLSAPKEAGLFTVAARLAALVAFPMAAVSSVVAPMISEAWAAKDHARLQTIATLSARLSFGSALLVCLPYFFAAGFILELFGSEFVTARPALFILCGGNLLVTFSASSSLLLMLTGHQKVVAVSLLLGALLQLVTVVVLLRFRLGATAAAAAYCAAVSLTSLFQAVEMTRRLSVNPTARLFGWKTPLPG